MPPKASSVSTVYVHNRQQWHVRKYTFIQKYPVYFLECMRTCQRFLYCSMLYFIANLVCIQYWCLTASYLLLLASQRYYGSSYTFLISSSISIQLISHVIATLTDSCILMFVSQLQSYSFAYECCPNKTPGASWLPYSLNRVWLSVKLCKFWTHTRKAEQEHLLHFQGTFGKSLKNKNEPPLLLYLWECTGLPFKVVNECMSAVVQLTLLILLSNLQN